MSAFGSPSFAKRSRRIVRNNRAIARRSELRIGDDGLLVMRPKRRLAALPLRGLLIIAAVLFIGKALMLAQTGAVDYERRVQLLAQGSPVEQAGAFVMQADPVSAALADKLAPLFR